MIKPMVQLPMKDRVGAGTTLQAVEDPILKQVEIPWRKLQPCRNRLLAYGEKPMAVVGGLTGAVACGMPTLEQSVPEGLHPLEETHAWGSQCFMVGIPRWSIREVRGRSSKDKVLGTDRNPHSQPIVPFRGHREEGCGKVRSEVKS